MALCTSETFYTPHAIRASVSVLPGPIFSFSGHLDSKIELFFEIWALLDHKNVLDRVILCSYGLDMHFWGFLHPPGHPGKCSRVFWPYFQLLRPAKLENRAIFRYLALFVGSNRDFLTSSAHLKGFRAFLKGVFFHQSILLYLGSSPFFSWGSSPSRFFFTSFLVTPVFFLGFRGFFADSGA